MEASPLPTPGDESWAEQFAESLRQQRDRVREFLAVQRERIERAEADLAGQLEQIAHELAQNRTETRLAREEIEQRSEQIHRETETLQSLKEELAARQAEWEGFQRRAAEQQEALSEQFRRQQEEFGRRHEEISQRQTEIGEAEARLHHDRRELELARVEHQAETEQLAAELEATRSRCDRLEKEAAQQPDAGQVDAGQLQELQAERDAMLDRLVETEERLAEAEERLAEAPEAGEAGGTETANEDLQRRFEMAMDDLRELKAENDELKQQLSETLSAAEPAPAGGAMDWEAEKQRMLAALESDFDEDETDDEEEAEEAAAQRLEIEEVIRKTDQVVAAKDREIEELKQLLELQSANVGSMAVGAAALGEMLDKDEIVREERENLKQLQQRWEEKLRKAEIDISVERAKNARQKAEIEEKLRVLNERTDQEDQEVETSDPTGKPVRGRWLARLGLKDKDSEP